MSSGQRQDLRGQGAHHRVGVAAGQIGAPDAAREEDVARQQGAVDTVDTVGVGRRTRQGEHHRPLGMARGMDDAELEPCDREPLAVGELHDVVRLPPGRLRAELLLEHPDERRVERGQGVAQPVGVVGVDRGGDAVRPAHGGDGVDVVGVAVGEQHRGGAQAVLDEHLGQPGLDPDAGVDDDALLTGRGRHDIAVRGERERGEADDEHARSLVDPPAGHPADRPPVESCGAAGTSPRARLH